MRNNAWGIAEYNTFGTDEFLRFCKLIGAQPQIALNLGSGTAQEAADWVQYVDKGWKQTGLLWELGNELWGSWNLGYPTLQDLPGRTAEFSRAIRAADPNARLIAAGQDPDVYREWNGAQLTDPPGTFQFLSTHFVVTTDRVEDKTATADQIASATFALPVGLERRLRDMQHQIDESANFRGKVRLAFTEWLFVCCSGRDYANAPRWDNMGGAVTTAGFLNMLMRNADVVPISNMNGIIEFAGIWKKRGRVYGTPAYYTFQMYSTAEPDQTVEVANTSGTYDVRNGVNRLPQITGVPFLDTMAVLNKARNRLFLFCVNRHVNQDLPASIDLNGFNAGTTASVHTVRAASIYEVNSEDSPEHIIPQQSTLTLEGGKVQYTFPHGSITRIDFLRQ